MPVKLAIGDVIKLRRAHPCGSQQWEVLRTGADLCLRCLGCGRQIWMERFRLEKLLMEAPGGKIAAGIGTPDNAD